MKNLGWFVYLFGLDETVHKIVIDTTGTIYIDDTYLYREENGIRRRPLLLLVVKGNLPPVRPERHLKGSWWSIGD